MQEANQVYLINCKVSQLIISIYFKDFCSKWFLFLNSSFQAHFWKKRTWKIYFKLHPRLKLQFVLGRVFLPPAPFYTNSQRSCSKTGNQGGNRMWDVLPDVWTWMEQFSTNIWDWACSIRPPTSGCPPSKIPRQCPNVISQTTKN